MKFICTFCVIALFSFPVYLFPQQKFVTAGLRLSALPEQAFIDFFEDSYSIVDFKSQPALKMGGGLRFSLSKKVFLEFEAVYTINPFNYLKNRQFGSLTGDSIRYIESFDYGGYLGMLEFASHIDYTLGKKNTWEIFAGIRFTSLYYTRQKGNFTREEYRATLDGLGNPQVEKIDEYRTGVGVSEGGITVRGLPEAGVRYWCLLQGRAGFELNGGVSISSIFPKDFRLRSHFVGLAYIQRWSKQTRNKQKI